ncbi:MAG: uracil-DNA glycosylase family protein [Wenzhouxiangellaceae bacterium]
MNPLINDLSACTHCASKLPLPPRPIFQLHENARLLIAGQAPGMRAHEAGKPFADASGQRLRQWLGVTEDEFYNPRKVAILPMGLCYPGKGASGDLPPLPECAVRWRPEVLSALPNIRLTLLLGQYALRWHLGERMGPNLTATVAAWRDHWPEYLSLPHPSPRNQAWFKRNPWFASEVLPVLQQRIRQLLA